MEIAEFESGHAPLRRLHPVAGGLAMMLIAAFLGSTVIVELFGTADAIAAVKRWVLYGIAVLVPAMALAGVSGFKSAGGRPVTGRPARKAKRMPLIAANGLLILLPCAVILDRLAASGDFGAMFVAVQTLELAAGPLNLFLMGLNMRDGLAMTRRRRILGRRAG